MTNELKIRSNDIGLSLEQSGDGPNVVLLHGLTATHRYVVMGSKWLERSGYRVIAYDARGHGQSDPAQDPKAYSYSDLVSDLENVLDQLGVEQCTLAGASMGAHTATAFALAQPQRVQHLLIATPAFNPDFEIPEEMRMDWFRLAQGLREDGVEGFMQAYQPKVAQRFKQAVLTATRQRLGQHRHLDAVADALEVVPFSRPFESWQQLSDIRCPTTIVGSRDDSDPIHPLGVAKKYCDHIPAAKLVVEAEGESPLAWRGAELSRLIAGER